MGLAGIVAQLGGRLAQGIGADLQLADHLAQFGGECIEVPGQLRDFVLAMGVEAAGQVAFAAGDIGHGVYRFLQRAHDAAGDEHHQQGHDQCNAQADEGRLPHLATELRLHIIHVDAGADDPTPGLEQLDIGGLGHRRIRPGLGQR